MTHSESIHYLEAAGFHYKPAESPDLWAYLEGHFAGPHCIGPKFNRISPSSVAALIAKGEDALLETMVEHHRRTGRLGRVAQVIELPYIVGIEATVPLAAADPRRVLRLVDQPGTPDERAIHVLPVEAGDMPCTRRITVTGGLYADGHTAGYYGLYPGDAPGAAAADAPAAYLATREEIETLAREMEFRIEDIATVTRKECEDMLARVKKLLG